MSVAIPCIVIWHCVLFLESQSSLLTSHSKWLYFPQQSSFLNFPPPPVVVRWCKIKLLIYFHWYWTLECDGLFLTATETWYFLDTEKITRFFVNISDKITRMLNCVNNNFQFQDCIQYNEKFPYNMRHRLWKVFILTESRKTLIYISHLHVLYF